MRPRHLVLTVAVLVLAVMPTALAGSASPAKRECGPSDARTLLASRTARVFQRGPQLFACRFGHRGNTLLGNRFSRDDAIGDGGGLTHIRLAGPYVAAADFIEDQREGVAGSDILLFDLRRAPSRKPVYDAGAGYVADLVLSPSGALAWLASGQRGRTVTTRVPGAEAIVRDEGPTLMLGSLALSSEGTLYWTKDSQARSVRL